MQFAMDALTTAQRYKLLVSTITPRPIAWTVTQDAAGLVNIAPHSFFNAMGDDPPVLALGLLKHHARGDDKDTAANIRATGEFSVALVTESDAQAMNLTAVDCPRDVSEAAYAGVALTPSVRIAPPCIASAPVNFECRTLDIIDIGTRQTIVLGEVVMIHVADRFVLDAERLHLDTPAMELIGRLHGGGWYSRTSDRFEVKRVGFDPERAAATKTEAGA